MPVAEFITGCPICGKAVPDFFHGHQQKYCSFKCKTIANGRAQADRLRLARIESAPLVACPICKTEFKQLNGKIYCSEKCKDIIGKQKKKERHEQLSATSIVKTCKTCHTERPLVDFYAASSTCKECRKVLAREYMRKRLQDDADFRQRHAESTKLSAQKNPERVLANKQKHKLLRRKHIAHVIAWKNYRRLLLGKHDAHVRDFRQFIKRQSLEWCEQFYTAIGKPWKNPHLTDAQKFMVRYRNDPAYRLGEINRQTWRKSILQERDDSTANFWALLKERKTCPYCGKSITKDNAVADHMNPLKLGGANSQHNLTICCRECNQRKSGKPFTDWLALLPEHRQRAALRWYQRKHQHPPAQSSLTLVF